MMTNRKCVISYFVITFILLHEQQEVSRIAPYVQSNVISLPIEGQSSFEHIILLDFMPQLMFGRM